jgi:Flp pilus assembly protein protease CpaA
MIETGIFLLGLIILIIASICDLKSREVPDWLSYTFLFTAIIANLIYSVVINNFWHIIYSLSGAAFGLLIGLLLFYTGQWGGGDSKIMIGIFTLIGFNVQNIISLFAGKIMLIDYVLMSNWVLILVNITLVGAIYGIFYALVIIIKNKNKFNSLAKEIFSQKKINSLRKSVLLFSGVIILLSIIICLFTVDKSTAWLIGILGFIPFFMFYIWVFAKVIDSNLMNKSILAKKITVGDWVMKDVFIDRRVKNIFSEALHEYRVRNECKMHADKFGKILARKYIRFTKGYFYSLFASKSKIKKNVHLIKNLICVSSKKKLLENAKKLKLEKQVIDKFLLFLDKQNIYFDKFLVCGFQNTGLNELQVKIIKKLYVEKKIKHLVVKEGIPFIPSFLIAYIFFQLLGFWWTFFL